MKSITDVKCKCSCGWRGTVGECEPDIDGDGSLGCPECLSRIRVKIPRKDLLFGRFRFWWYSLPIESDVAWRLIKLWRRFRNWWFFLPSDPTDKEILWWLRGKGATVIRRDLVTINEGGRSARLAFVFTYKQPKFLYLAICINGRWFRVYTMGKFSVRNSDPRGSRPDYRAFCRKLAQGG